MASPRRKTNVYSDTQRAILAESARIVSMPTPVQTGDREPRQMERIGDILRRERERRGDDLQQIADYLCIRRTFLTAIENSEYDKFPADAYVIGFLRSYAEYLGLDGKEVIDYYRSEMAGRRKKPVLALPTPISEGRTPSVILMTIVTFVGLLIYAAWYGLSTSDRTAVSAAPALPTTAQAPAPPLQTTTAEPTAAQPNVQSNVQPTVQPTVQSTLQPTAPGAVPSGMAPVAITPAATAAVPQPASTLTTVQSSAGIALPGSAPLPSSSVATATASSASQAAAADTGTSHLTIRAEQASWILIADTHNKTLFDRVLKPGETFKVPDQKGLTLTTGNGAGIVLTLDGTDLPRISSNASHIIRAIPLDPKTLKEGHAASDN